MGLIERIAAAMIRQEGMPADYANPFNLRGAPWLQNPVVERGFWKPPSRIVGIAGGIHVIALHVAQGNTLRDFIAGHPGVYAGFAPGSDRNDPVAYVRNVAEWAQIPDPDAPLWNFLEPPQSPES